jgi:hypothetical protein
VVFVRGDDLLSLGRIITWVISDYRQPTVRRRFLKRLKVLNTATGCSYHSSHQVAVCCSDDRLLFAQFYALEIVMEH